MTRNNLKDILTVVIAVVDDRTSFADCLRWFEKLAGSHYFCFKKNMSEEKLINKRRRA